MPSRTFTPLPMTSSAESLPLEGPAYIWARRHRRDPDKGSMPIAMRAHKAGIKDARGYRAEDLAGSSAGGCGSVRARKSPKAAWRNEHKSWFAPIVGRVLQRAIRFFALFLGFLLDRHPRDRSRLLVEFGPEPRARWTSGFCAGSASTFRSGCRQAYRLCLCRRHRRDLVWSGVEGCRDSPCRSSSDRGPLPPRDVLLGRRSMPASGGIADLPAFAMEWLLTALLRHPAWAPSVRF